MFDLKTAMTEWVQLMDCETDGASFNSRCMLATGLFREALPPTFVFWRGFAQRLFTALCHNPNLEDVASISVPKPSEAG